MILSQAPSRLLKTLWIPVRTATKRASGGNKATNNTAGRRLGPKKGEGEPVTAGQIIFRQRGTVWYPGENALIGRDHTISAKEPGFVRFYRDPFHPKRKFIGVALDPSHRLPTPHCEPRRRRLGFKKIEEPEIAHFEESFFRKKEVEQARRTDSSFERREQARTQRLEQFEQKLVESGAELNTKAAAARLVHIFQFMRGGATFAEARDLVDAHQIQDIALELKTGRVDQQEHDKLAQEYRDLVAGSDSAVMLGPRLEVCRAMSSEQLDAAYTATVKKIESILEEVVPEKGTSPQVKTQILDVLASPELSLKQVNHLKSLYIRRPEPVLASCGKFDELVKKKQGKFVDVWNKNLRKMQKYFVPENAIMHFKDCI